MSSRKPKHFSQKTRNDISVFQAQVYTAVQKISRGRVATYGNIARMIRKPTCARAVGNALNRNIFSNVPCHRVVRSNGAVGGYAWGSLDKVALLRAEGIVIVNNYIDLKIYGI